MDYINQGATALNNGIDVIVKYITENGVAIAVLLAIVYFVRTNVSKNPSIVGVTGGGHVLAQGTSAASNATSREEELRQVRLRQQELASERAAEAAKLRKEQETKEKERKNNVASKKTKPTDGDKLGNGKPKTRLTTELSSTGFNPMLPGASHSSGYRPARRTVNYG